MEKNDTNRATGNTGGALCRDCLTRLPGAGSAAHNAAETKNARCAACGSPRLIRHDELFSLTLGHVDCDAFFAAIEKRDNPKLRDQPVIVGGGRRGVVATCCYIARTYGIHSAMPLYRAKQACPRAVVVPPDMKKYRAVGRQLRQMMEALTPLVEPLSIDEAFLDLAGTERLHGAAPAASLAGLAARIESEIGITVSVGLSYNKFMAKLASDMDKPRGFAVLGQEEALAFLAAQPVGLLPGIGKAFQGKLRRDGITRIGQLQGMEEKALIRRYGVIGSRLARFSQGQDARAVNPHGAAKSISSERTFDVDISAIEALEKRLWGMSENVSASLKSKDLAGGTVTLKLRIGLSRSLTRSSKLDSPTQLAHVIFERGCQLLRREATGTAFRLLGIGVSGLTGTGDADQPDLLDPGAAKRAVVERAMDQVRGRFGGDAIKKGRAL